MKSDLYSQIDRKFEESSTSNEGSDNELVADDNASLNSMYMKLDFLDRVKAEIIFNSLSVDKEPKRSTTRRLMSLDGTIITAKFSSDDQKSLIRSANNFFDMCQLSKSCIDMAGNYAYKSPKMKTVQIPTKKKHNK